MRLSADASGANAVKNVLETSSKHSANDRRRWWDMGATESVPCFEGDGRTARLQVWDASGEHARRGEVPDVYYQDAFGALLVYDITSPTTFDTVLDW